MERTGADVDGFLAGLPDARRDDMVTLDQRIRSHLGSRERELWEGVFWGGTEQKIIGYARIEQPRPKGEAVEWFLIGLALQKDHVSLYVNAAADGAYLTKKYASRLGKAKVGAAAVTITRLDAVDLDALDALIAEAFATLDGG
ncbi:MAG: DUF1801 domain-containing protein [Microcella sp.]|uniref:DUF1801 domain-containing protein n=1 Tax=Microcella sp. TaxID=1913979 RepID=UPI0033161E5B